MKPMRDQSGFTLIEVLVASILSLFILGVTLTVFTALVQRQRDIERQTEVEAEARLGVDRLSRQLRNLASPSDIITNVQATTQPKSVDRNLPYDLIFKDISEVRPAGSANSANVRRVRYCLQTSGAVPGAGFSASSTRGVLWMQAQTWTTALPPAMPATVECPGTGWGTQQVVGDHLLNASVSPARPVFRYSGDSGLVTATTDAARETIARVETTMVVDPDPTRKPKAATLTTSVILRNQNRAPISRFTYTLLNPVLSPTTCSIQLNGSASEDPESKPLEYQWIIDSVPEPMPGGVVVQKVLAKGTHTYQLKVYDRAHLEGISATETHTC
jgi:prepilin-type N-terminal cleavage/methylation domain-containing protein